MSERLSTYPFVELNLRCRLCSRSGSYRIVRLAAKYGSEIDMQVLLRYLAGTANTGVRPIPTGPAAASIMRTFNRRPSP